MSTPELLPDLSNVQDVPVPEIVKCYPQTAAVFRQFGLPADYVALQYESLSASVRVNLIDLPKLLEALHQVIKP